MPNDLKSCKLNYDEKKIHVIWIGKLPPGELDNLKIWANLNQDYEINIWTDSNHSLTPLFRKIIIEKSSDIIGTETKENPLSAAHLKNEFYQGFIKKTMNFNDCTKQFILNKGWQKENEIEQWINEARENLEIEKCEIGKYTSNNVRVRDVYLEVKDRNIFNDKIYYGNYLRELEEFYFVVGASDLLRYEILGSEGGIYLDTDMLPRIDFTLLKKNNQNLTEFLNKKAKLFECKDDFFNIEEVVINELIKLNFFNKLNEEEFSSLKVSLKESSLKVDLSIDSLKEFSSYIKEIDLKDYLKTPINDLLVYEPYNFALFSEYRREIHKMPFYNSFLISKKEGSGIQEIKNGIINKMHERYKEFSKLNISNIKFILYRMVDNQHVIDTTGPGVLNYLDLEKIRVPFQLDPNRIYYKILVKDSKILMNVIFDVCSLDSINSVESSWLKERKLVRYTELEELANKFNEQKLKGSSRPDTSQFTSIDEDEELLACTTDEVKNYVDEGQSAASTPQSVGLNQKEQLPKTSINSKNQDSTTSKKQKIEDEEVLYQ